MDADARAYIQSAGFDAVTELVAIGGCIVLDDLVPIACWPEEWSGQTDYKREFAFRHPRVIGAEVQITPVASALLITRIG